MAQPRGTRKKAKSPKVAMISLHTSPQDPPGAGDAGGMNVYIQSVARRLAEQGIDVDIYTRCHGQNLPHVQELRSGTRLIQVQAGPCAPVLKEDLPTLLPSFLDGVIAHAAREGDGLPHRHSPYDVVHGHYWLSGWVGSKAKLIWGAPLVTSFHTLAKVKNTSTAPGERPEPEVRLRGEQRVVRVSDRILTPTPAEADDLVSLYDADPGRIRVVAPGVDRGIFAPRPRTEAKARLHMTNVRLLLFVGRLQPLKGPEIAIRAVARTLERAPELSRDLMLAIVGGPAGAVADRDEVSRLMSLAAAAGVADRVVFYPPQPHDRLADFYSAADVVVLPSRSESFGLVALEAQACGTPVIAAAVGGLRYAVADGQGGILVRGHDPGAYADAIVRLLQDDAKAATMSRAAVEHAAKFSWDATAAGLSEVYRELSELRAG